MQNQLNLEYFLCRDSTTGARQLNLHGSPTLAPLCPLRVRKVLGGLRQGSAILLEATRSLHDSCIRTHLTSTRSSNCSLQRTTSHGLAGRVDQACGVGSWSCPLNV